MIVRMKEILIFTLASAVNETVYRLGELGVVDIAEVKKPQGESLEWRTKLVESTEAAINILQNYRKIPAQKNRIYVSYAEAIQENFALLNIIKSEQ